MTSIVLEKNIEAIYGEAFENTVIKTIYCKSSIPPALKFTKTSVPYGDYNFDLIYYSYVFPVDDNLKIYVPKGAYEEYIKFTSLNENATDQTNWYTYKKYIYPYDYQNGTPVERPRPIAENNKIYYTTTDGKTITTYEPGLLGVDIMSNIYEDGIGVITCKGDITTISSEAFRGKTTLLSMTLPESVTQLGQYMFYNCSNLKEIYCKATTPPVIYYQYNEIGSFPFKSDLKIYVPSSSYAAYTQYSENSYWDMTYDVRNWGVYKNYVVAYNFQ